MIRKEVGPDYDVDTHLTPNYNPWDQRVCLVPDSDLFVALREGKASIATDEIDHFTPRGIALKSGEELPADVEKLTEAQFTVFRFMQTLRGTFEEAGGKVIMGDAPSGLVFPKGS